MFRRRISPEGNEVDKISGTPNKRLRSSNNNINMAFRLIMITGGSLMLLASFLSLQSKEQTSIILTLGNSKDDQPILPPFFSIEPLTKSLHPKYKLWTEMNTKEQDKAMEFVKTYMNKYGKLIAPEGKKLGELQSVKHGTCEFDPDIGRNGHTICGPKLQPPCTFISFGINNDPSFDVDLGKWGCRGFSGDPTVHHPSKLHPSVTFHNIGATMLQDNEERLINKGGTEDWWMTSFPKLRYFLGLEKIDILKIDCEGCEVALARDMLREDPTFLHHVDQISIETHMTKTWMTTREHVYYFGLLLVLLEEAGFVMEWSSVFGCSKRHEVEGCMEDITDTAWPCGYDPWPGHPKVVKGRSCQEYTWKRYGKNNNALMNTATHF